MLLIALVVAAATVLTIQLTRADVDSSATGAASTTAAVSSAPYVEFQEGMAASVSQAAPYVEFQEGMAASVSQAAPYLEFQQGVAASVSQAAPYLEFQQGVRAAG